MLSTGMTHLKMMMNYLYECLVELNRVVHFYADPSPTQVQ